MSTALTLLTSLYFSSQTEFMKRKVEGEGWDTQLGVWGRGVEPDLFSPARRCQDLRRQLGLGPNDIAALWLGRVVKEKKPGVWLQVRGATRTFHMLTWYASYLERVQVVRCKLAPEYFCFQFSSSATFYPPPTFLQKP